MCIYVYKNRWEEKHKLEVIIIFHNNKKKKVRVNE